MTSTLKGERPFLWLGLKLGRQFWLGAELHTVNAVNARIAILLRREGDGTIIRVGTRWVDIGQGVTARLADRQHGGKQATVLFNGPIGVHIDRAERRAKRRTLEAA